jgi:putative restriction endonuclease
MSPSPTRMYIGVTDNDWFHFLRNEPEIDEVNFWKPSGSPFRGLQKGGLFLFKLHSPDNYIAGGGFFMLYDRFPFQWAWGNFGRKNGAASLLQMKRQIEKYRRRPVDPSDQIGCIILSQPFFWDRAQWIPAPADFSSNIPGKFYAADSATARDLWAQVSLRLQAGASLPVAETNAPDPMYGEPTLVRLRLGQGTFRALITDNYQRRCAVTGEKALPVLDAAHIRPVKEGGQHRLDNGLLLRSDVHRLFDSGYVTVTPDGRFLVSRRLKDDFDNGEPYMPFNNERIWMPGDPGEQPDRQALEWHADAVFLR